MESTRQSGSIHSQHVYDICTDEFTVPGIYEFVFARNTLNTEWVSVYAYVYVEPQEE